VLLLAKGRESSACKLFARAAAASNPLDDIEAMQGMHRNTAFHVTTMKRRRRRRRRRRERCHGMRGGVGAPNFPKTKISPNL
jgi:hypothetical protein